MKRDSIYAAQLKFAPIALFIMLLVMAVEKCSGQTDSTEIKLSGYKDLFIKGLITSQEYEALKQKTLGIPTAMPVQVTDSAQTALYDKGRRDAKIYFKTGGVVAGTLCTTLFAGPLFGLIPAIACSGSTPNPDNFYNRDASLLKQPDYLNGYKYEARRQKKHAAWSSWGAGFAITAAVSTVTGILISQQKRDNQR